LVSETPHFRFEYPREWKSLTRFLRRHAEDDLTRISRELSFRFSGKLTVRLASPGEAYASVQPGKWKPHPWVAGLAYLKRGLMTLRVRAVEGPEGIRQTFVHELSHLVLARATRQRPLPLWFIEGVAMTQAREFGSFERFLLLSQAAAMGRLPPLSELRSRFPPGPSGGRLGYALSYEFILYLQSLRADILAQAAPAVAGGESLKQSLSRLLKRPWSSIIEGWKSRLRQRYTLLPVITSSMTLWFLMALLFLWAYRRVKRKRQQILEQWESEEEEEEEPLL